MDGIFSSWARILGGYTPSLSIEITRECPLRCPGCYAYGDDHLGGVTTLRGLRDFKGQALIDGVHALVDRHKPLHVSIVGGEPLVRYRELNELLPQLSARGLHVQVVTSAVRPIPREWASIPRLSVVVSIDGLPAEHDVRRAPATYDRILKHIEGQQIVVHCTVTRQLVQRSGYLEEFAQFWQSQPNCRKIWFSLYTPQIGEESAEKLRPDDRRDVVATLLALRERYKKIEMPQGHDRGLRGAAGVARGVHLRARDAIGVGRPRDARHAVPVRRTPGLRQLRVHRLGGPGRPRTLPAGRPAARRSRVQRLACRGLGRPRRPPAAGTSSPILRAARPSDTRPLTMRRRVLLLVCLLSLPASLWAAIAITLPNAPDSLKFAVIGDSGSGAGRQYQLAAQFAAAHKLFPFSFVLMLGDNIYGRETAKDFFKKFELPYKAVLDAGVPFYAALGNHDEPVIQINYKPFNMDGKRYYSFRKGDVECFAIDSTYMSTEQVRWVEKALSESNAPWKIAYMHHPTYSSGKRHGSEVGLRAFIEPLFIKYGVSVVLAGHEHFYERLKPQNGIAYFTSGAAGKLRAGNIRRGIYFDAGFDTDLSFMLFEQIGDDLHFQVISRLADDRGQRRRQAARPS